MTNRLKGLNTEVKAENLKLIARSAIVDSKAEELIISVDPRPMGDRLGMRTVGEIIHALQAAGVIQDVTQATRMDAEYKATVPLAHFERACREAGLRYEVSGAGRIDLSAIRADGPGDAGSRAGNKNHAGIAHYTGGKEV